MTNNSDADKLPENVDNSNPFSYDSEIVQRISLIGEKFTLTKKTKEGQVNIEKRWTTSTKKIEIPVKYEEIYIDGKKIDSHIEGNAVKIFAKIKDKIKHVFTHSDNKEGDTPKDALKMKYYDAENSLLNDGQNTGSGKTMPFTNDKRNLKTEDVITIWGEEIIINKRMVKLGEFVVKKYEVTETKEVDVELITEKLTIHQPNSHKEEII
jgi:stress response protein YsnF